MSPVALLGIGPDQDRVGHLDDLVDRQVGTLRVFADRLGAGRLVDADGPNRAGALVEHVAADPADVVGHLLVADLPRTLGGHLEVSTGLPTAPSQNHIGIHSASISPRPIECQAIQPLGHGNVNEAGTSK